MTEENEDYTPLSMWYLTRIIVFFVGLAIFVAFSFFLPLISSKVLQYLGIGVLIMGAFGFLPFVNYFYKKSDEFNKTLYQEASGLALPIVFTVLLIIGVLQANSMLKEFNAFWVLVVISIVFGMSLMLKNSRYFGK